MDPFPCTCCEPTPRVSVANPSSISSEISSDGAGGGKPLVIVHHPGRLAGVTPGRLMGHFHAGDLAGAKPFCMSRGGGLLIHLVALQLQNSHGIILAHLQNPQEERAAFQVEFPPRNPSEMHTRDYPINISSYAHWGGGYFSSHCTSVSTTGGCRRCPGTVVSPPKAQLSSVMTDLLCPSHPAALRRERNFARR